MQQPNDNNNNMVQVNINELKKRIHRKEDIINAARELGYTILLYNFNIYSYYFPASQPGYDGTFFLKFLTQEKKVNLISYKLFFYFLAHSIGEGGGI